MKQCGWCESPLDGEVDKLGSITYQSPWISTADRPPEIGVMVFVRDGSAEDPYEDGAPRVHYGVDQYRGEHKWVWRKSYWSKKDWEEWLEIPE